MCVCLCACLACPALRYSTSFARALRLSVAPPEGSVGTKAQVLGVPVECVPVCVAVRVCEAVRVCVAVRVCGAVQRTGRCHHSNGRLKPFLACSALRYSTSFTRALRLSVTPPEGPEGTKARQLAGPVRVCVCDARVCVAFGCDVWALRCCGG